MFQKVEIKGYLGIDGDRVQNIIPSIKNKDCQKLNALLSGDAPKDFIRIYEYDTEIYPPRKRWVKYIAKVGHKWYPNESISEYLMNRIGISLGLKMASSKLVSISGQIRFLSRYFLLNNQELVHGAEIFANYLNDELIVAEIENKGLARDFFTFEFTCEAIRSVFPDFHEELVQNFIRLLVFDAIVGNNDRHMYNWGVVRNVKNKNKPVFSPIYDTARGLFWNQSDEKIASSVYNMKELEKYIENSRPKTGLHLIENINHFTLIEYIYKNHPQYQATISDILNDSNVKKVNIMIDNEFSKLFSNSRLSLIQKCLYLRFEKLISIIT